MGRLVITRLNKLTWKIEQITLENIQLEIQYVDEFGRYSTLIKLKANNPDCLQKSFIITEVVDQRLVEGIHYNQSQIVKDKIKEKKIVL